MCELLPLERQSGAQEGRYYNSIHLAHWEIQPRFHTKLWKGQKQFWDFS